MDDAAPVRRIERVGNLAGELEHARGRHRARLDQSADGDPFETLHYDERLPLVLTELVDGADMRVLQRRGEARFPFEPRQPIRGGDRLRPEQLDRHVAPEPQVLRPVDNAHSSLPNRVEEAIVRDHVRNHCRSHDVRSAARTYPQTLAVVNVGTRGAHAPGQFAPWQPITQRK
jgi:hypothetical protein